MDILEYLVMISGVIIFVNLINHRFFHKQKDIFLVLATFVASLILLAVAAVTKNSAFDSFIQKIGDMEFEEYVMDCVLCFMLFAGAKDVSVSKFKKNFKPIVLLSLLSTAVSAVLFGVLFWGIGSLIGIELPFYYALLLGCIVSPTDPIAATGILSKMGLSDDAMNIIECESLFNDGAGVTLYVFVKGIIRHSGNDQFVQLMIQEIFGAVIVAFIISFVGIFLMKHNSDKVCSVLISIFSVGLIYLICEKANFSGAIASVVCGMFFAAQTKVLHEKEKMSDEIYSYYCCFWDMADGIFNSILFCMIGICMLSTVYDIKLLKLIPLAIVVAVAARYLSVAVGAGIAGKKYVPGHYTMPEYFTLMTWCGLRGGLCLALAMSSRSFLDDQSYYIILNSVYVIIFFTVVIQGLTIQGFYEKLENKVKARMAKTS